MKTNDVKMNEVKPQDLTPVKTLTEKKAAVAAMLKAQAEEDAEMVTGKFKFYEVPGGRLKFPFLKHKGQKQIVYDFYDDQVYTIPRGVANHLNINGWYPEYEYNKTDGISYGAGFTDEAVMRVQKKVHRFGFQSLEFMGSTSSSSNTPSFI